MSRHEPALSARLAGFALAFAAATAAAHEFWVEPTQFTLAAGGRIGLRLCLGDGFDGWSLPRNPARIERFVARGAASEVPVVGLDGSDPAGVARLVVPGGYIVGYASDRAFTEVPLAEFREYVSEKGLDGIVASHARRGERRGKLREAYSRHAKALVRVGDTGRDNFDRAIGLRLELVAESRLRSATGPAPQAFRLLYEGEPLAGALVVATRPGTEDADLKARTDADGRAAFRLHSSGMWRVAAVHMIDPPAGVDADWESLWASLTFELPSAPSAVAPAPRVSANACRNRLAMPARQARS
ncbi:MAG: DUF4198 domain-containing protein [Steroidobacteraceae bacterium]